MITRKRIDEIRNQVPKHCDCFGCDVKRDLLQAIDERDAAIYTLINHILEIEDRETCPPCTCLRVVKEGCVNRFVGGPEVCRRCFRKWLGLDEEDE